MADTDVTKLIAALRHLSIRDINGRLAAIESERQALLTLRRVAVRSQRTVPTDNADDAGKGGGQ